MHIVRAVDISAVSGSLSQCRSEYVVNEWVNDSMENTVCDCVSVFNASAV